MFQLGGQEVDINVRRRRVKPMKYLRLIAIVLSVSFLVQGCASSTDLSSTSLAESASSTLLATSSTTSAPDSSTTSTELPMVEETTTTVTTSENSASLDIVVFDWTETRPPGDVFVQVGDSDAWNPDIEFGGDGPHYFGTYDVGTGGAISFWPDDPLHEIKIMFEITAENGFDIRIHSGDDSRRNLRQ